jgi:hypothetical protein
MDVGLLVANLLSPPVLFFFLGALAVALRSDLEVPQPIPKLLSLYLLLSIGFKGGVELRESGDDGGALTALLAATLMSIVVPLYAFAFLRRRLDVNNAAALAAAYGSVSAVTFITASAFLRRIGVPFGGYMVACLALMESPAIVIGVMLARMQRGAANGQARIAWDEFLREALFNGSVLVLVGSLIIGAITGSAGKEALYPFTNEIFTGALCLFLLDMGLVSARRVGPLLAMGAFPLAFAVLFPLLNAALGLGVARLVGMSAGDAILFVVLCASASYIAVPAAIRLVLPEANPGLYVSMPLAFTFPFNVTLGIPLYTTAVNLLWPG